MVAGREIGLRSSQVTMAGGCHLDIKKKNAQNNRVEMLEVRARLKWDVRVQSEVEGIAMQRAMRVGMGGVPPGGLASLGLEPQGQCLSWIFKTTTNRGSFCHYNNKLRLLSLSHLKIKILFSLFQIPLLRINCVYMNQHNFLIEPTSFLFDQLRMS